MRRIAVLLMAFATFAVMALIGATPASAQGEQQAFDAAQAAWDAQPSESYTMSYTYCDGFAACEDETVVVEDGIVIESDTPNGDPAFWEFTVDDNLAEIQFSLEDGDDLVATYAAAGYPTFYEIDLFGDGSDLISLDVTSFAFTGTEVNALQATVTCLAGNGRIDVNIVNETDSAVVYRLEIGTLPARQTLVQPSAWWRSPVTGRPDGPIDVTVLANGAVILDTQVTVACDQNPTVSNPEVQLLTWCIGDRGMVFSQFANPTAQSRSYIVDVGGIRRSTTAAAYGATVRGVSGRPDGVYAVDISVAGTTVYSGSVTVDCE